MNDLVVSWIRTVVPALVGGGIAWLATALGVDVDVDAVAAAAVAVAVAVYYAAARLAERRWPALGFLLGSRKPPSYSPPPATEF